MYNKILLPTDGSKGSEIALEHVLDLAGKYEAELHVLFVADVRVDSTNDMWANILGQLEEVGEDAVSEIAEKIEEANIEAFKQVVKGVPHKEINSYADENDIDLIAMSTHGRTGVDRLLLGSVTEKVIRTSKKPVLTVGRTE